MSTTTMTNDAGPLRVGVNAALGDLNGALAAFPGVWSCRVFGAPGRGIPAWDSYTLRKLVDARVTPWVSFKDWPTDVSALAAVNSWLDRMPDYTAVWLTYHHEPEGDLPSDLYRARWVKLATAVRAHRFRSRVTLAPIHTLYPARHKASDRYASDWTRWTGVWQQWHPTMPDGSYAGDLMGWDCYLEAGARRYEHPESFFRIPVGAAHQAGVRLVVPELGALPIAGLDRGRWITDCVGYLRSAGVAGVNWWHGIDTKGNNYALTDGPSIQAWRQAIDAQTV